MEKKLFLQKVCTEIRSRYDYHKRLSDTLGMTDFVRMCESRSGLGLEYKTSRAKVLERLHEMTEQERDLCAPNGWIDRLCGFVEARNLFEQRLKETKIKGL